LPPWLGGEEVRLDIDPDTKPDIVASMTDMGEIGPFDAVYSSHALEHLYPHDVPVALAEFLRVLRGGGMALVIVPDLEDVRPTEEVLYETPAGPVAALDLYYGYRPWLRTCPYMAHHTGFISATLEKALAAVGFQNVRTQRLSGWNLMGVGLKLE
jgi:ubiquinone/menaquinone biosynthesis C-methylase UbiE